MNLTLTILFAGLIGCTTSSRSPSADLFTPEKIRETVETTRKSYQEERLAESLQNMEALHNQSQLELSETSIFQIKKRKNLKAVIERLGAITENPEKLFTFKISELEMTIKRSGGPEKENCETQPVQSLHVWWTANCILLSREENKLKHQHSNSLADFHQALSSQYNNTARRLIAFLSTSNIKGYPSSFLTEPEEEFLLNKAWDLLQMAKKYHNTAVENKETCDKYCFYLEG